ncbi:Competence protein [Leptospira interrogans serovar Canicola]|nr:Competence protein [Leptospira interrogans serovar Canicola]
MEKHIRNWIPCSAFSKFSLGTLTGIVIDLIFPGTVLLWAGFAIGLFSISHFFKKTISNFKIFYFWNILSFICFNCFSRKISNKPTKKVISTFPKKIHLENRKKFSKKNSREQVLLDLKEAGLEKNSNRIALGLIFGESKQLSQEFKTKAKEGGILHLFAASGLHLGVLMGVQFRLLSLIPSLGYNTPRIIPLLTGFLYLSALGYPTSLARAWIFAGMLLFQGLFFRKLRPVDLLLGSAWILWLLDPIRFYSVSFCLSFGAVTGIFFFFLPN